MKAASFMLACLHAGCLDSVAESMLLFQSDQAHFISDPYDILVGDLGLLGNKYCLILHYERLWLVTNWVCREEASGREHAQGHYFSVSFNESYPYLFIYPYFHFPLKLLKRV